MLNARKRIFMVQSFSHSFLSLVIFGTTSVQAMAEPMQLQYGDLAQLVRQNNRALKASELVTKSHQARIGDIKATFMPSVTLEAAEEVFKTGQVGTIGQPSAHIEATVNLFRGGKDELEIASRTEQAIIAETDQAKVFSLELSQVRKVFWRLIRYREELKIWAEIQKLNEKNYRAARRRVSRGLGTGSDVLAFEIFTQKIMEETSSAHHEIHLAEMELIARLQLKADSLTTNDGIPHEHDDQLMQDDAAMTDHPEVMSLFGQKKYHSIQSQMLEAWWLPKVDFFASYGLYTSRDRDYPTLSERQDWVLGVRASMNLFDKQLAEREAQSETIQSRAKEELASHTLKSLEVSRKKHQEEMHHLHALIHGSEAYLIKGRKLLAQVLAEYDRGLKSSQDVLMVIEQLLALKKQDLERRQEYQNVKVDLLAIAEA